VLLAHAPDAGKHFSIDEGCDWLAVLADDDAVIAVLYLVEHFAQALPEIHSTDYIA